ncbi:orotate phosphoribosyltransferase, putative [Plasmodium ovale]|uniref:orotate phosphoribosyltransferase n=2 Tax=Plasmodium ovale TaxID=36330 RepID=A0A1A8W9V0_PLAOA|nr:orotate phosphoribosyltransferase [Plasmodium ovale curtisi]SBS92914.1 orotate phosphoribosyltransferase [Plasmodium ovale curtisi]SCQ16536.1 orotate phosphoribosyltransferase, putative [Plasmodium ovale]
MKMQNGYNKTSSLSDEEIYRKYTELRKCIELGNEFQNNRYMNEMKKLLIAALIKYKAIKFGEFVLKSKRKSKYFFSSGVLNNIVSANIISFLISNLIVTKNIPFDYLLGTSYKGIPLATLTSHFLFSSNKFSNVFYLYDRKEKKEYGDKTVIVGNIEDAGTNEGEDDKRRQRENRNCIDGLCTQDGLCCQEIICDPDGIGGQDKLISGVESLSSLNERNGLDNRNGLYNNITVENYTDQTVETKKSKNVIIIDDVFTCGTALTEIMNKLKCYSNLKVIAFIVLLNRNEYDINEKNEKIYFKDIFEQKYNIPLYSILNYDEDLKHLIA